MRSWQIIAVSAAGATIADALLLLPGALPWRPETVGLLLVHWPAITIVWLGFYAIATLGLSTDAAFIEIAGAAPRPAGHDWVRRYVARLAVTQYFTSVLALLGLGLSPVPVETAPFVVLPSLIDGSPAFAACGAVVVVGLLGALFLTAAMVKAESPELRSRAPGMRAGRLLPEITEPPRAQEAALANPAADAVQLAQEPAPANAAADAVQLAELIERGQRPVLEAVKDLATAVNRLRRDLRQGLGEIKLALHDRGSERSTEAGSAVPSAAEDAAIELRGAAAAVDASVARLAEIALLLSANEMPVAGRDAPISPAARSRLSTELHELLREMTPAAGRGDPPG